jgi:hypothetical protein
MPHISVETANSGFAEIYTTRLCFIQGDADRIIRSTAPAVADPP